MNEKDALINQLMIAYGEEGMKNLEIIDVDQTDNELYHISFDDSVEAFIPRFSTKLFPGESRSIPRTSTSPMILKCLLGFGDVGMAYMQDIYDTARFSVMHIYQLQWQHAVKPNTELCPDADYTDEHWLIAATPKTREYYGMIIGSMFLYNIEIEIRSHISRHYTWYLRNQVRLQYIDGVWLEPGYYKITLHDFKSPSFIPELGKNIDIDEISKEEYLHYYQLRTK